MHERNKGPDSFWHEWFEVAQLVDLPYSWDDSKVDQLVDVELQSRLRQDKGTMAKEWASLKAVIKLYEPSFFAENEAGVPMSENEGLFHWACNFSSSRAFGTSLGTLWLCPLIDLANHDPHAKTMVDVIHTKLHLAENKIYMHDPHFPSLIKKARLTAASTALQSEDQDQDGEESQAVAPATIADLEFFVTGKSRRMHHSVVDLYDHCKIPLDDKQKEIAEGKPFPPPECEGEHQRLPQLFKTLYDFENSDEPGKIRAKLAEEGKGQVEEGAPQVKTILQQDYEEAKEEVLKNQYGYEEGIQLWTLVSKALKDRSGPLYYGWEQDEDQYEYEEDEEEARQAHGILERLSSDNVQESEDFEAEDFEYISSHQYLRQAYANRWYRYDNPDTFFILVNDSAQSILPGQPIHYPYGNRSNRQLLETYGFVLSDKNPSASAEFRIILSTNPKEALTSAKQLLPEQKILDDYENIDNYTETAKARASITSDDLLCFLRSVLMTSNYDGPDKRDIMVGSPAVLDFEIVVMSYAIELLQLYQKRTPALQKPTLEQDRMALAASTDFVESTILQYNIQYKSVYEEAIKVSVAAKEILERLSKGREPMTSACFRALECEKGDTFE